MTLKKQHLIPAASVLILLGGLVLRPGSAIAQGVRAMLVRDADEPGRNAFQDSRVIFGGPSGLASNAVTFNAVPPGKRLIITHVSILVSSGSMAFVQYGSLLDL